MSRSAPNVAAGASPAVDERTSSGTRSVLETDEFSFLLGGDLLGSLTFLGHTNRPIDITGEAG